MSKVDPYDPNWRDNFNKQNAFKKWNEPVEKTDEEVIEDIEKKLEYILNPYHTSFGKVGGNLDYLDRLNAEPEISKENKEDIENDLVSRLFEVLLELKDTEGYEEEPWWTDMLILAERLGIK